MGMYRSVRLKLKDTRMPKLAHEQVNGFDCLVLAGEDLNEFWKSCRIDQVGGWEPRGIGEVMLVPKLLCYLCVFVVYVADMCRS